VRYRWIIEGWHWIRDTQLHEDAHRYRGNGAGAMATLRTAALNLLRLAGLGSIRAGMQAVMHDIRALLAMAMRIQSRPLAETLYQPWPATLRTSPKSLLRLLRQRWAIVNQWQWPRDTDGEDTHHYTKRNGVQVLALLRTLALNLLCCNAFQSIRAGLMAVAHDISQMLGWAGIRAAETR